MRHEFMLTMCIVAVTMFATRPGLMLDSGAVSPSHGREPVEEEEEAGLLQLEADGQNPYHVVASALDSLVEQYLEPSFGILVNSQDPDEFRQTRLYTKQMDAFLFQFMKPIKALYAAFKSKDVST